MRIPVFIDKFFFFWGLIKFIVILNIEYDIPGQRWKSVSLIYSMR